MEFQLVRVGNRPLFAIPTGNAKLQAAAVACYPAHTWKKHAIRAAVRLAFASGISRKLWAARELSLPGIPPGALAEWLANTRATLGDPALQPTIVWPGDPQRGRLYVHLINATGRRIAFCKLALDVRNSSQIRKERLALERLQALQLKSCRIPAVRGSGQLAGQEFLIVAPTPPDARATNWQTDRPIAEVIAEYGGPVRNLNAAEVKSLDWWSAVEEMFPTGHPFRSALDEAVAADVAIRRVHGDVNQTNVLRAGEEIWLLDWEQSDEDGPVLTDRICAAVDDLWLQHPADPSGNLVRFKLEFLESRDETTRHQVVLALAFLATARFPPAIAMIQSWYPA